MSAERSIRDSATSIATNESALIAKQRPTPKTAITAPAAAGPAIREQWTTTEFSETALTIRSGPTSSITKAWRAGLSIASTEPRASTSPKTIQGAMSPVAVSAHSVDRGHRHQRLRVLEQAQLRHAVGEQAAPGAEQQHRQELERGGDADGDARAGELHDQPHLGDDLHPVAGDRDDLAGEVPAVVRDREGGEGAPEARAHARSSSSSRSRIAAARSSAARSSGSSFSMRCAR